MANATTKKNSNTFYEDLMEKGIEQVPCIKKSMLNLVGPDESEESLETLLKKTLIITSEDPAGCDYDKMYADKDGNKQEWHVVLRLLDGKLIKADGKLDAYAWSGETFKKKVKSAVPFGTDSGEALENLSEVLAMIKDPVERRLVSNHFSNRKRNILAVISKEEDRTVCFVSKEMYDNGFTYIVDEWNKSDENGEYPITEVYPGDAIYLNMENRTVYRIGKDEFEVTHKLA